MFCYLFAIVNNDLYSVFLSIFCKQSIIEKEIFSADPPWMNK